MKNVIIIMIMLIGAVTVNAQNLDVWVKKFYVDDFGDKTNKEYVGYMTEGSFSNSATVNSDCYFKFVIDDNYIIIDLYEYNSTPMSNYTSVSYTIKMKNEAGVIVTFKGDGYKNVQGVIISKEKDKINFLQFLEDSNTIKIIILEVGSSTKYNAVIKSEGFIRYN